MTEAAKDLEQLESTLMAQIDGALMLHHLGHADAARAAIESITNDS